MFDQRDVYEISIDTSRNFSGSEARTPAPAGIYPATVVGHLGRGELLPSAAVCVEGYSALFVQVVAVRK